MRIVHTADVHLDHSFAGDCAIFGHGQRRRNAIRTAFHHIIERCIEWPADALFIAGDLFESNRVTADTLAFLKQAFSDLSPIPVLIAPGKGDPYGADSPYARFPWPQNVRVFLSPAWQYFELEHLGLTVHGFAHGADALPESLFAELDVPCDGRIHIVLAHGAERALLQGAPRPGACFDRSDLDGKGISYAAMGSFHTPTAITLEDGCVLQYPGAPEPLGFDMPAPGHCVEIIVEDRTVHTVLKTLSRTAYIDGVVDVSQCSSPEAAGSAVDALLPPESCPAFGRIRLTGAAPEWFRGDTNEISDFVSDAFEHIALYDESAIPTAASTDRADSLEGMYAGRLSEAYHHAGSDRERGIARKAYRIGLAALDGRTLPLPACAEGLSR